MKGGGGHLKEISYLNARKQNFQDHQVLVNGFFFDRIFFNLAVIVTPLVQPIYQTLELFQLLLCVEFAAI